MTAFWRNWLTLWCIGTGVFGIVLYGAAFAPTTLPTALFMDLIGSEWPTDAGPHLRFAFGLMGSITIGWMITFYTLCRTAWMLEPAAARPLWRGAFLSIAVWYVIDGYASITTGFPLNVASNTVLALALSWPIWRAGYR
jgi:hypothetical protein